MALKIFRKQFYDDQSFPIHIPNRNEDTSFVVDTMEVITDAYKKLGRNLFYYDVNSLYPFIMKKCPMPGGKPVWDGNLVDKDIDSLFGFIEAFVSCPSSVKKTFSPRSGKRWYTSLPTGDFVGVYYSEELKYARDIGYTVIPAKKDGNEALSFVYKILMNSLYGRFGINPNSTKTELCDSERYHFLMKQDSFIGFHPIIENLYMVSYHTVTADDNIHWAQPKNSAVQLSAAITACARIYMHPFISRDDCYYTDTDSIVLANPLPEGLISSKVLGLFKLEDKIKEGYFLAPKAYGYISEEDTNVIKFKGPAKHLVDISWFREQLANPSRRMKVQIKNEFGIDWDNQTVGVKEYDYSLGIKLNSKRITQPDGETLPIEVNDMCGVAKSLFKKLMKLQTTNTLLNEKLSQKERESEKRMDGVIVEEIKKIEYLGINIETTLTEESTQLDKEESDVTKTDSKKPDT
uniref:DNA-directed DNA polymerase n=1 Tax=Chenopodium quinoa TaxID=63459 RepID=A0A803NCT6_CHEQI